MRTLLFVFVLFIARVYCEKTKCLLELVMIVKNEAKSIVETIYSVQGIVDRYCILDTGSTDNTVSLIKNAFISTPGNVYQEPFVDFATTRNRVLELAGNECQYTLMLSGDEYLRNGGVETVIKYGETEYNSIRVCNTDYHWKYVGVTHEYVTCTTPKAYVPVLHHKFKEDVYIIHDLSHFDIKQKQKRWKLDASLLAKDLEENPTNARSAFYLAQSYDCLNDLTNAYHYYQLRYEMGGWFEERYESLVRMANVLERMGYDWSRCETQYLHAYEFLPQRADPLYHIARHYYDEKQYHTAFIFASKAMAIPYPKDLRLFLNPVIYQFYIPEMMSHICTHIPNHDKLGLQATQYALDYDPNNKPLLNNLQYYNRRLRTTQFNHIALTQAPPPFIPFS